MADSQRIEDLRRRVQKDPASIAFAQLAEECRRAGYYQEAVDVCQAGLALHPGYLSARVTLGRALIELNELEIAFDELTTVLKSAPENLTAIRGLAEIYHRRNDLPAALAQYRVALALAKNDPDLQQTVAELARQVEPPPPSPHADGLSFEQMASEFMKLAPPIAKSAEVDAGSAKSAEVDAGSAQTAEETREPATSAEPGAAHDPAAASAPGEAVPAAAGGERTTAVQTIAELERFLDAIHVARAERGN
jgi:tetratricopeptide (TPR) repeat protein